MTVPEPLTKRQIRDYFCSLNRCANAFHGRTVVELKEGVEPTMLEAVLKLDHGIPPSSVGQRRKVLNRWTLSETYLFLHWSRDRSEL